MLMCQIFMLEKLRESYAALPSVHQQTVKQLLPWPEADILWQTDPIAQSQYDLERAAPFNKAINVYEGGVAQ